MMWLVPLLVAVISCEAISLFELQLTEWEEFKIKYGKSYTVEEDEYRIKIYLQNKLRIQKHNLDFEKGVHTYKLAMNKFGDLLSREYYNVTHSLNPVKRGTRKGGATFIVPKSTKAPDQIDWRDKGAVTVVKDQGNCSSAWAFSAIGALEGQYFRKTGVLTSLSEQNLIDCSKSLGNDGCNGGLMDYAFDYIRKNGGIDTEAAYPYEAKDDTCKYNPATSGAIDYDYVDIDSGDEIKMMQAVAMVGPLSAGMFIPDDHTFQFYDGGVYNNAKCDNSIYDLNHALVVVGYGTVNQTDYWLAKNSWGLNWGENGYVRMVRNNGNVCGIATYASYPLV